MLQSVGTSSVFDCCLLQLFRMTRDQRKKISQILQKRRTRGRSGGKTLTPAQAAALRARLACLEREDVLLEEKTMDDASLTQLRATLRALRQKIKEKSKKSFGSRAPVTTPISIPEEFWQSSTAGSQKATRMHNHICDNFTQTRKRASG